MVPGWGKTVYNKLIRPFLPDRLALVDGVGIPQRVKAFDNTQHFHEYERATVDYLRQKVTDGDSVTIIGGGIGVTGAIAGWRAGPSGRVTVYEPDESRHQLIKEVWEINEVPATLDIQQAAVGEVTDASQEKSMQVEGDFEIIEPGELVECDVLEIDIEGAELDILASLEIRPRVMIVETHEFLGTPTSKVRDSIESLGFTVLDIQHENPDLGVDVILAELHQNDSTSL